MTNSNVVNIDGIGSVLFEKSKRAKRVIIYVRFVKGVRVAVPARTSFKKALEFVHLKKQWIQKNLKKTKRKENQQKAFLDRSLAIDRADTKKRLTDRLNHLAEQHGFTYNKISIREQKTRWGSCSNNNNISLNYKLILLPKELIDYVILHELVHTRIHNHSKKFWTELDRYTGNSKAMAKKLRMNDLKLI